MLYNVDTKYNIGDKVYINNGKEVCGPFYIQMIRINCLEEVDCVYYKLDGKNQREFDKLEGQALPNGSVYVVEEEILTSKKLKEI